MDLEAKNSAQNSNVCLEVSAFQPWSKAVLGGERFDGGSVLPPVSV